MPGAPHIYQIEKEDKRGPFLSLKSSLYVGGIIFFLILLFTFVFFQKLPPCLHLPRPLPEFVGRKEVFKSINKTFNEKRRGIIPIVTLWGEGGIGKTETAIAYANEHLKKFSGIYWINAGSQEVYEQSYLSLAEHFGIVISNQTPFEKIRTKIHDYLEGKKNYKPWLLIYDNMEQTLPFPERGNGRILATARNKLVAGAEEAVSLPFFSAEEAKELYKKFVSKEGSNEWLMLAEQLDFYPLALNQALHAIKESTTLSIKDYTQWLSKNEKAIFTLNPSPLRYPQTLAAIWEDSKKRIQEADLRAYEWLEISSTFHPDQVPLSWVASWLQETYTLSAEEAKWEGEKILKILANQGHIHLNPKSNIFTIHRLKQHVIRLAQEKKEEIARKGVTFLISQLKGLDSVDRFKNQLKEKEPFMQWEANAVWWLKNVSPDKGMNQEKAYLHNLIANIKVLIQGKYSEALEHYKISLEQLDHEEGVEKNKISILLNIAYCYRLLNDYSKNEEVLYKALSIINQFSQQEVVDLYIFCLRSFAEFAHWTGDSYKSISWVQKAFTVYQDVYQEKKDLVLVALHKWMGFTYFYVNPEKSLYHLIQALEIFNEIQGKNETFLKATVLVAVGRTLGSFSESSMAIRFLTNGILIIKKLFPNNYVEQCLIMERIAEQYVHLGEYKKSLNLLQQIDKLRIERNPSVQRCEYLFDLIAGLSYLGLNKPEKGLYYLAKGFEKDQKIVEGQINNRSLRFILGFGDAYFALGELEKAISYYDKCLKAIQEHYSNNFIIFHSVLNKLSKAWQKLDKQKAVYYQEWAKEVEKKKPKITPEQKQALLRMI